MSTPTNNNSLQNLDELDRQIKQAEMIRQYLQVTNIDRNTAPMKNVISAEIESNPTPTKTSKHSRRSILIRFFYLSLAVLPLSSFNFHELRQDLKMAEERVERLRQELKEIQKKRDESFVKPSLPPPPPPYIPPNTNSDYLNTNISTSPLVQEVILKEISFYLFMFSLKLLSSQQNQRQMINSGHSSPLPLPNYNLINHLSSIPGTLNSAFIYLFFHSHLHY